MKEEGATASKEAELNSKNDVSDSSSDQEEAIAFERVGLMTAPSSSY